MGDLKRVENRKLTIRESAYKRLSEAEFDRRIERAYSLMQPCVLCPRRCKARRLEGELGKCRTDVLPKVSSYNVHHGEEPPISAGRGSGTIFFSYCNLRCLFCQNYPISQLGHGNEVRIEDLARMMLQLQAQGCHNINFVTPTHVVPQILAALKRAAADGLSVPLVYNSGGYDMPAELKLLEGIVDIYLPDMKYADEETARTCSGIDGYPQVNRAAILEMYHQVGILEMDEEGVAYRGLLIRHLVLPNNLSGTTEVLRFIAGQLSPKTYVSLMSQYFPAYRAAEHPALSRRLTEEEYSQAVSAARNFGLENVWLQS